MEKWNQNIEKEISLLIKDWLKQKGKTQKDLRIILKAGSDRMPALMEVLKEKYRSGGLAELAGVLCDIEQRWSESNSTNEEEKKAEDPFGQLDLLLEEIKEDCNT
ncbi:MULTISPECIES: hypothetical protein [unclassified Prochlorococcus]|uniref:hypothetical protein n=1 Tax=unclassified Prochlorococcus TaxID=2627481 RepID=UPI00053378FB|nr:MULTISPECIES: hypothetical protein [unclassified Prochlorococcus]KGG15017.1 hypothetical protein EV06_1532 [Prochlorococcus sp. MIT 0602]KGG17145.1 hypothetical protein EV07_0578 [Prochlorococcus sp. MIT 0603]